jgi:hypothetical protein
MTSRWTRRYWTLARLIWPCYRQIWPGRLALARKPGWQPVYYDSLAVVLVREPRRFPKLDPKLKLPEAGPPGAAQGRAPFPGGRPARLNQ